MRSQIILILVLIGSLIQCDQTPTTFDKEPYIKGSDDIAFSMTISQFDFDFLSQEFFFSVTVSSPVEISEVVYNLDLLGSDFLALNDLGQDRDILIGDGHYDGSWRLPDSMSTYVDSMWTLEVILHTEDLDSLREIVTLKPMRPAPPTIGTASHADTLTLLTDNLVLDTLTLQISHPAGLDEIRSVSMMSLKPDGNYANEGEPIPLYDDGGSVVFYTFSGIDFTSGDTLANDGIYSLLLALAPNNLSGTYHWTFNAKTWLGMEATPLIDSVVVLPAESLSRAHIQESTEGNGVFN